MFLNILILLVGFVLLVKGADIFVDGSSSIAKILKVPSIIIGLTVVALGTSAPELAVSITAAAKRANELAISNVIGSNIFNLLVVLGVCAIVTKVPVEEKIIVRDLPLSIGVSIFLLIASCFGFIIKFNFKNVPMSANVGMVSRLIGAILLLIFIIYIVYIINYSIKNPTTEVEEYKKMSMQKSIVYIILGLVMIVCGGEAVVNAAKELARLFGMSETLIGLTIVAVGTSLPELATSLMAARKNEVNLAVGNAVGSNIFNMLLILGTSSVICPIAVNFASMIDLTILIFVSILVLIFALREGKLKRYHGIIMLLIYIATVYYAIIRK